MRRASVALASALATLHLAGAAFAAPVRGTVELPSELKSGRRYRGYWRVENGLVPIQPPLTRPESIVVLTGAKGAAPPAKTYTVEISALQPSQTLLVVGEGSVVEFKNNDKVPHDLASTDQAASVPLERLAPGGVRRHKFPVAGGFHVRCLEYPNVAVSVIVVSSPFHGTLDEKGAFKLPDAPDGKATLKVWSQGRWVHEEAIDLGASSGALQIKVARPGGDDNGDSE